MADKVRYPQIPSTVWWGVRSILQRTPNATIDERLLGVQLGVQEAAAKAYIGELRSVGILTEDNKATPLAQRWRLDDSYSEASDEIVKSVYPEGLVHVAPPGEAERQKVVQWFLREGLGQGAAGNKAATYLLLSSPTPNESPRSISKPTQRESASLRTQSPRRKSGAPQPRVTDAADRGAPLPPPTTAAPNARQPTPESFPLNVNIQIHISADAGTEQIETIFQAMKRYLYDSPNS